MTRLALQRLGIQEGTGIKDKAAIGRLFCSRLRVTGARTTDGLFLKAAP